MEKREEAVRHALGGKKEGEHERGEKLHTHGVHYERAHNGGVIAHVHRHTGEPGRDHKPHHVEEHVLPDMEAAGDHLQEHMGDQPASGEMEPQQAAAPEPDGDEGAAPGGL